MAAESTPPEGDQSASGPAAQGLPPVAVPQETVEQQERLGNLTDAEVEERVLAVGGKRFQARQISEWLHRQGADSWAAMYNVPKTLRDALAATLSVRAGEVVATDAASDGTVKILLRLHDGETVEAVTIPDRERMTLCISTQVGCPVGCIFCASGMAGVRRNLETAEILEQVLQARAALPPERRLTNLVVMGIGEPLLNLEALLPALERIHDPKGIGLGARRITVSTSGYPRQMLAFAATPHPFNLAVSLHAADDTLRKRLVPSASAPVAEILDAARHYFNRTGREVTFEIVLLAGVNDGPQHARDLIDALHDFPCTVNLLAWNPVVELAEKHDLARPTDLAVDAFAKRLRDSGLNVTVRRSRGSDQSAACGQLRIRKAAAAME